MASARKVRLRVHYEMAGPFEPTWWADSPDIPGFSAVYPSLGELQRQAEDAVRFALEATEVELAWETADDAPLWAAVHIQFDQPEFAAKDQVTLGHSTLSVGTSRAEVSAISGAVPAA
jgi:predicted RNase H-like HicB family nuclease